ncbi:FimV family protein [Uliginosibacterium paludis]|uniref:FimV N-terminal domain-containing protein n=1 Tax=Uliginosibacterium paludis TaxID=1615952 RepID=A0ABV2CQ25_9RHOO
MAGAASILMLGLTPASHALGLGSASTRSRVDSPIRIEIPIQSGSAESVDLQCVSLASQPVNRTDDLPWLSKAKLTLETHNGQALLVISAPATSQPVIMLGVLIRCDTAFRRDYTILLDPPLIRDTQDPKTPPAPQAAAPVPQPPAPVTGEAGKGMPERTTTQEGDSARSIANRLRPGDAAAQRRLARALLTENQAALSDRPRGTLDRLPAGIELIIPRLSPQTEAPVPASAQTEPRPARQAPASERRSASDQPRAQERNRLIVSGNAETSPLQLSGALSHRRELSEPQRERLRTEMQLLAALDEKIATQLELAERLRQLEALQNHLREDADRLEHELRTAQSAPGPAASQTAVPVAARSPLPTPPEQTTTALSDLQNWLAGIAALLLALLLAGMLIWRRKRAGSALVAEAPADPAGGLDAALIEPLSEADIWPDEQGQAPKASALPPRSLEGALSSLSATGFGPPSILQIVEGDVEEHDSAVELADIMMSFGRVQGAAQTLADFIRVNPKQAVKPWIKLLEVYRAADMRPEYEALCSRLNKTFNVRPAPWDEFELARQAPDSLENLPHIVSRLTESWGRRECQAFLHTLLRDNRQGTRSGFPLAIIDEILLLLSILERQLGPYRPEATDPAKPEPSTRAMSRSIAIPTVELAVPPIIDDEALSMSVVLNDEKQAPDTFRPYDSNQLDFDLDMTDLSKTLHIDLDQIGSADEENPPR